MPSIFRRLSLGSCAGAALLALTAPVAAHAQSQTVAFDIPAQDLASALRTFARQSGQQVIFEGAAARGKTSQALKGGYVVEQGLDVMLRGSGLGVRRGARGVLMVGAEATGPQPAATAEESVLSELVVTANKREETLQDVAGAVTAVGAKKLEQLNALKLADYVAFVPGLQLQPNANSGFQSIVLRGIAPQFLSSTTATYVDEIPVGSASNVASGAYIQPDIDPFELQRVEVLNGPQGTLYGATALGGLIKYVTKSPDLNRAAGNIGFDAYTVAHGSEGGSLRAAGSIPLVEGKLALGLSGHYRKDAGWIDDSFAGKDANEGTVKGLRGTLYWEPTDATSVKLSALFDRNTTGSSNTVDIDPTTRQRVAGKYDQRHVAPYDYRVRMNIYSATVNHAFGNGLNLTSATGYSRVKVNYNFDSSGTFIHTLLGLNPDQAVLGVQDIPAEKLTQEIRLTSPAGERFEWMVGGFYQHEKSSPSNDYLALNANQTPVALPYQAYHLIKHNTLIELAGFANATLHITPKFDVTLGYRYSAVDQRDDTTQVGYLTNPRAPTTVRFQQYDASENVSTYLATASYHVSDDLMVYGRAASGYRPGGSRSIPNGAPATFVPSYESDSIWNYEVGLKGDFLDRKLSAQLTGFWIDWSDIQQAIVVNTFFTTGNGGKARSRGVEAAVQARPITGLNLNANLTYTDAKFREDNVAAGIVAGQRIPRVAEWNGALGAEYNFPVGDRWTGFVGGEYAYTSSSKTVEGFRQDAYGLLGIHAGATNGSLRLNAYVKNLTDTYKYIATADTIDMYPFGVVIPQPRTVGVTVSKSF